MGITHSICPADVDETIIADETAIEYVIRVARKKCSAPLETIGSETVVLAADTAVVIDGEILGKPRDGAEALTMLQRLSGRSHEVLTGVAVGFDGKVVTDVEMTKVTFARISAEEARWYVETAEPLDKAGAYALQGIGALFIEGIEGTPDNVVGLPRRLTATLFRQFGIHLTDFVSSRHTG